MAHELLKVTQKLYGVPHLISESAFENIEKYLNSRNAGMMDFSEAEYTQAEEEDPEVIGGIGVIEIFGPLTYRKTGWEAVCGGASYESIMKAVEDLVEAEVSTIVLSVDSGGGQAYGCFICADEIRKICDEKNIRLIGYVDGLAASAAYGLICVCDEIVSNPYAEVGSIGVLISLLDDSKYMDKEGFKRVFISAGKNKIPYAEDGSFKKPFLDDLQMKVDSLYESFVSHVSKYTGLSTEAVKATEAKTFLAQDALQLGLVNKIMTNSDFIEYVIGLNKEAR